MPRVFQYTLSFRKAFEGLSTHQQLIALKTIEALKGVSGGGPPQHGLRIKRLHAKGGEVLYEARAGIDIRVVWLETHDSFTLTLVGDHDEIRKFIKRL